MPGLRFTLEQLKREASQCQAHSEAVASLKTLLVRLDQAADNQPATTPGGGEAADDL
jgi:hypothetical protein